MPDLKIHVIGEEEIVLMLGLLGIDGTIIENENNFLKHFNKIVENPFIGMLIIALDLSEDQLEYVIDFKLKNVRPFIYHLPDVFSVDLDRQNVFSQLKIKQVSKKFK